MTTKTLKTKRVFAYAVYNHLRNTAPKDYPTVAEIKSTISSILPALKESVAGYLELFSKVQDLADLVKGGKLSEEESRKSVEEMNAKWKEYNQVHGNEIVDVVLDEESLKTLKTQFERDKWGKNWFANIEEFAEFADSLAAAEK